jgi:hypothetical protein
MTLKQKPPKPRKCKVCRVEFTPARQMQAVCGGHCALSLATSQRARAEKRQAVIERKELLARKERIKTRGDWQKEAQASFNAWIRARDAGRPCICCGRTSEGWTRGGEWDAGHYRSRGAAPHLRFDERNVHAQLKQCNRFASGNVVGYRKGLIERIGMEAVESLESDEAPRHYSIDDLKQIKTTYAAKRREIEKERA